jgi:hypothetical protein
VTRLSLEWGYQEKCLIETRARSHVRFWIAQLNASRELCWVKSLVRIFWCQVTPAVDGSTVTFGTGAEWIDVDKIVDEKGLVVGCGGRDDLAR